MAILNWLQSLNLDPTVASDYEREFAAEGFQNENELIDTELTIPDFQKLKVKIAHRRVIVKGIEELRKAAPSASPDQIAEARFDLVVRFVAVVISVGFATRISQMGWLITGNIPSSTESQELLRLVTALFVIISGWEWYHRDVWTRPLKSWPRFLVDIIVVVVSLVFLLSSKVQLLWLAAACGIFLLYVVWDALSIREFRGRYDPTTGSIWDVYWQLGKNKGVAANIEWFMYFVGLFAITWFLSTQGPVSTLVCCTWVVVGVARLRFDAGTFTIPKRTGEFLLLLILFAVVMSGVAYTGVDRPVAHWLDSFQPKKSDAAANLREGDRASRLKVQKTATRPFILT